MTTSADLIPLLEAGRYVAALAVALLLATAALRRYALDAHLPPRLRPWIPLVLALTSWALAVATGALDVAEAAALAVAAALGSMGLHDLGQAVRDTLRPPGARGTDRRDFSDERPTDPGRPSTARRVSLAAALVLTSASLAGCAPGLAQVQRALAGYHVVAEVSGDGAAATSARFAAVRGEAGSSLAIKARVAPGGDREAVLERRLDRDGVLAWRVLVGEREGESWLRLERATCAEALDELPEIGPCPDEDLEAAGEAPEVVERRVYLGAD